MNWIFYWILVGAPIALCMWLATRNDVRPRREYLYTGQQWERELLKRQRRTHNLP